MNRTFWTLFLAVFLLLNACSPKIKPLGEETNAFNKALVSFMDSFEVAVLKHDAAMLVGLWEEDYRGFMLEKGDTSEALKGFFNIVQNDGSILWPEFESIQKIEFVWIEDFGAKPGSRYLLVYDVLFKNGERQRKDSFRMSVHGDKKNPWFRLSSAAG